MRIDSPNINVLLLMTMVIVSSVILYSSCQDQNAQPNDIHVDTEVDGVVNGIDTLTGMAYDEHFELVRAKCISCHSPKLITQNRATREGWKAMIDWMYKTQNLKDLGTDEPVILDYLAKHYAPEQKGRRANLAVEEWYELKTAE